MRCHKTSILIVNTEKNKTRQIPTHLLVHWRRYVFLFILLLLSSITFCGFYTHQRTCEQYHKKLAKANYIRSLIDIRKAKAAFSSIDSSMYRINSFLHDRGLEKLHMENVGGGGAFEITDINEVADYYSQQLAELEYTLRNVPLGKPYRGEVTSHFGYRRNPFGGGKTELHGGIDFRGNVGDTIRTTGAGKVVFAGYRGGYGKCVIVQHAKKLKTLYAHLSHIDVKKGQKVKTGQFIGRLGNTGRSTGPHLHYEIIHANKKINPKDYLHLDDESY